jgi:hypothetical protein
MANAFQQMLERFGLTEKILAFNADNATSNDKQTKKLDQLDNSFNEENRARCFNHTIQLSAKALLKPFNTALSQKATDNDDDVAEDDDPGLLEDDEQDEGEEGEEEVNDDDVEDDNIDELDVLDDDEREEVLAETAAVRTTVSKVNSRNRRCLPSTILIIIYHRFDYYHLPSFVQLLLLSPLGVVSALNLA